MAGGRVPSVAQEPRGGGGSSRRKNVLRDAALPLHTAVVSSITRTVTYLQAEPPTYSKLDFNYFRRVHLHTVTILGSRCECVRLPRTNAVTECVHGRVVYAHVQIQTVVVGLAASY